MRLLIEKQETDSPFCGVLFPFLRQRSNLYMPLDPYLEAKFPRPGMWDFSVVDNGIISEDRHIGSDIGSVFWLKPIRICVRTISVVDVAWKSLLLSDDGYQYKHNNINHTIGNFSS